MGIRRALTVVALGVAVLPAPLTATEISAVAEAVADYMDFATYDAGIITPQQLDQTVFERATFVDTREAAQFDAGSVPGAINIEWREIPGRLDELPDSGMVILFCNTGSLSAQAVFAARLLGKENVLVLQTGLDGWKHNAAWQPN